MVRIADNAARLLDNQAAAAELLRRSQLMPVESVPVQFDEAILVHDNLPFFPAEEADVSDYLAPAAAPAAPLQYNHIRWFDPAEGIWLSTAPAGYCPGDENLFRYVVNDPTDDAQP